MSEASNIVSHLKDCRQVDAAIVVDGNSDSAVASLLEAGWTFQGQENVEGKRVRYLAPPSSEVSQ